MIGYRVSFHTDCHEYESPEYKYGPWVETYSNSLNTNVWKDQKHPDVISIHDNPSGSEAFIVWVEWTTGDSFGRAYCGSFEALGLFIDIKSAKALKDGLEGKQTNGYDILTPDSQTFKTIFAPWDGYFDCLESVNIETVTIA